MSVVDVSGSLGNSAANSQQQYQDAFNQATVQFGLNDSNPDALDEAIDYGEEQAALAAAKLEPATMLPPVSATLGDTEQPGLTSAQQPPTYIAPLAPYVPPIIAPVITPTLVSQQPTPNPRTSTPVVVQTPAVPVAPPVQSPVILPPVSVTTTHESPGYTPAQQPSHTAPTTGQNAETVSKQAPIILPKFVTSPSDSGTSPTNPDISNSYDSYDSYDSAPSTYNTPAPTTNQGNQKSGSGGGGSGGGSGGAKSSAPTKAKIPVTKKKTPIVKLHNTLTKKSTTGTPPITGNRAIQNKLPQKKTNVNATANGGVTTTTTTTTANSAASGSTSNTTLYIVGGIVLVIAAIYFLKK